MAEAVADEELRRALLCGTGENALQLPAARLGEDADKQLRADSLALEPAHRIERHDLAGPLGLIPVAQKRSNAGQMTGRDRSAVTGEQDLADFLGAANLQEPFALSALEQSFDLAKVVDPEPFDAAVILEGEEGSAALVREELASQPGESA